MEDIGVLLLCTAGLAATASGLPPFLRVEIGEVGDEHVHIITTIQGCFAGGRVMAAVEANARRQRKITAKGSLRCQGLVTNIRIYD